MFKRSFASLHLSAKDRLDLLNALSKAIDAPKVEAVPPSADTKVISVVLGTEGEDSTIVRNVSEYQVDALPTFGQLTADHDKHSTIRLGFEVFLNAEQATRAFPAGKWPAKTVKDNADLVGHAAQDIALFLGEIANAAGLKPLPDNRAGDLHFPVYRDGFEDVPSGSYAWNGQWEKANRPNVSYRRKNGRAISSYSHIAINAEDLDKFLAAMAALEKQYQTASPPPKGELVTAPQDITVERVKEATR